MRKTNSYFITILILTFCCLPREGKTLSGDVILHDPSTIVKEANKYWTFSTGEGIKSTYSSDLFNWTAGKQVFDKGKWPSWINNYVKSFSGGFWAPDIVYMNNKYYLYYACSSLGSSVSVIGLATTPTLDQKSPDYKWTDQGAVVSSSSVDDINAIDPSIFTDSDGKVYLTYGSYFNGIGVIELNPATGKVKTRARLNRVAGGNASSFEAPCIIKEGSYYYLFVNRAHCCWGPYSTYYIVAGRSTRPTGPFIDRNGLNLRGSGNNAGGTTVMVSSGRYIGPGHFGLLRDKERNLVSTHYYDGYDGGYSKLDISQLQFTDDGWPIISRDVIPSGRYKIANVNSKMVFESGGCAGQESTQVLQNNDSNYVPCQLWDLTSVGDGYYKISNGFNDRAIDIPHCNSLNGVNLQTWTWLNNYCQKFKIEQLSNGNYVFTSLANTVLTKVIESPSSSAGALLDISDYNGAERQQWNLKQVNPPIVLNADSISNTGFIAKWSAAPYATSYKLDVSTTFGDAAFKTIAAWNFESGNNTATAGIPENLNKTINSIGTNAPVYTAGGNGGKTAVATGWASEALEKYWEINLTTKNYYNLKVSSKQRSASTGPLHFKIQYKIGQEGTYTDIPGAFITDMDNYSSGALNDIDLPEQCNDQAAVYLRWLLVTSVNSSDLTILNTAESNIDDIVIKGNPGNFLQGYSNLSVTDTTQVISAVSSGTDYYYRVRAMSGSFTSANSEIIKVTTKGTSSVHFISLNARQEKDAIMVNWNIYHDKIVKRFEVEKSINGQWFNEVDTIAAKPILNKEETYSYRDKTPNQDESFYRIKAVLESGESLYSSVVKLTIEKGPIGVIFYPNPVAGNTIFIRFSDRAKGSNNIVIFNSVGQQVFKKQFIHPGGFSVQTLSLSDDIPAGVYHLMVTNGSNKSIQPLIIN